MRICLVLEGCYPYVHGGVSTWMHGYITAMPEHEFVLWVIGAHAEDRGKFVYDLPGNVVEVHEVFLDDALRLSGEQEEVDFDDREREALSGLALQSGLGRAVRHFPAPPRASALIFAEPHVYGHLPRRVSGRVPVYAFRRRLPHHAFDVAARALSAGQRGSGGRRVSRHLDRLRRSACKFGLQHE